ncbi:MAG: type II toxin-antitoxin system HicB family antitoxin [Deltaproteobacteria bacterium]|jgi:predicted HicB family RNase H-like nuclease|nr:type II toxin-antitoxin system HicB family antitoxin [Deltaproteobacteria bacterium]
MKNVMEINGVKAVIAFDPEINMFRGEFVGLNGGADFYSTDIDGLRREGETSLKVFLDMCVEEGVSPYRKTSGRLNLRLSQELYDKAATLAKASGKSVNAWIADVIRHTDDVLTH